MSKPTQEEIEDLILSARFGELEEVTAFADKFGWDAVSDAKDERGNTVLHMACGNGHLGELYVVWLSTRRGGRPIRERSMPCWLEKCVRGGARHIADVVMGKCRATCLDGCLCPTPLRGIERCSFVPDSHSGHLRSTLSLSDTLMKVPTFDVQCLPGFQLCGDAQNRFPQDPHGLHDGRGLSRFTRRLKIQ